jgi:hypothetical protein
LIDKLASEGHSELIETALIVDNFTKDIHPLEQIEFKKKPLVCFCREGKYYLFSGSFNPLHNKVKATVITKFTLKKCKVEVVATPSRINPAPYVDNYNRPRTYQRDARFNYSEDNNQRPAR